MSTTPWEVVDEDDARHFTVTLSAEGLRRSADDNDLLANIRKPMTKRVAIFIGASIGLVGCFVLLVVDSIIRNS